MKKDSSLNEISPGCVDIIVGKKYEQMHKYEQMNKYLYQ